METEAESEVESASIADDTAKEAPEVHLTELQEEPKLDELSNEELGRVVAARWTGEDTTLRMKPLRTTTMRLISILTSLSLRITKKMIMLLSGRRNKCQKHVDSVNLSSDSVANTCVSLLCSVAPESVFCASILAHGLLTLELK